MKTLFRSKKQQGFSVVSLMISIVLGAIIVASIATMIAETKKSYQFATAVAEVQENGRYAINVLSNRLRMAGSLMGCSLGIKFKNTLTTTPFNYNILTPVDGFEAGGGAWSPAITDTGLTAGNNVGDFVISGTDLLLLRRKTGTEIPLIAAMSSPTDSLFVASNNSFSSLATGNIVAVSDYENCSLFQVTNYDSATGQIDHQASVGTPGNMTESIAGGDIYSTTAKITGVLTEIFYIGTAANGEPTLYLKSRANPGVELVSGIEDMQVFYGEDLNHDASADRYLPANSVNDMKNVVSIKINLLVRSREQVNNANTTYYFMGNTVTANDRRLRREFTSVIQLRNRG